MPIHTVTAFLQVALDEGSSVIDYARKAGVAQSVMSRHLLDLREIHRTGSEGLGLIEARPSLEELRRFEVYLSDKGRALAHQIARSLNK
jgi:DNA-binding MarR family transcriptional regulator